MCIINILVWLNTITGASKIHISDTNIISFKRLRPLTSHTCYACVYLYFFLRIAPRKHYGTQGCGRLASLLPSAVRSAADRLLRLNRMR